VVIVWRVRGKIIRSVLCNIVHNNCAQCNAHTYIEPWGPVPDVTYNVFSGTSNPTQSINSNAQPTVWKYWSRFPPWGGVARPLLTWTVARISHRQTQVVPPHASLSVVLRVLWVETDAPAPSPEWSSSTEQRTPLSLRPATHATWHRQVTE